MALGFGVRAYISGVTKTSLWFNYESGQREIGEIPLPDDLRRNERSAEPILTPATKLEVDDRNVSRRDAVSEDLTIADLFDRIAGLNSDLFRLSTWLATPARSSYRRATSTRCLTVQSGLGALLE